MASIKLPRLSDSWIKNPSYFTRAWNQAMTTIEDSINSIAEALAAAVAAQTSAANAQSTADDATTAAGIAQSNAATAQSTANSKLDPSVAAATYAPINNPSLTGMVTIPTPSPGDSTTKAASTAFVSGALVGYTPITGAWTSYTPTIGSTSGTITTASASGRWLQIGKTIFISISVTITTNGTGAGAVTVSLPIASRNADVMTGRERALTGNMLEVQLTASGTTGSILFYNNGYPGANGAVFSITGVYETT